jgi:hypothetical protein
MVIPRGEWDILPPAWTIQEVERTLGNIIQLEVSPRYAVSPYLMVGGRYRFSSKAADEYRGLYTIPGLVTGGSDATLDASVLGVGSERVEHQLAASISFSTVALARTGNARWPMELTYVHMRSVAGTGRMHAWVGDQVGLRVYTERWRR